MKDSSIEMETATYFFKEKSKIDLQHSRSLTRLIKDVKKNIDISEASSSINKSDSIIFQFISTIITEHLYIANQSENNSIVSNDLSNELKSLTSNFLAENSKISTDILALQAKKNYLVKIYANQKKICQQKEEEVNASRAALPGSQNQKNPLKNSLTKLQNIYAEKQAAYDKEKGSFEELQAKDREALRKYFYVDLPTKYSELETLNSKKIARIKASFQTYLNELKNKIYHIIMKGVDTMVRECDKISSEAVKFILIQALGE
ncbi:hypothetical protein HZS_7474 [Henneguya salminicola]|nr:hypothetical protein HZS_7474 [Henneguya salminicola]